MSADFDFLIGGGELGALMRTHDWTSSRLGSPEAWPQSLRSVVGLLLGSKFPMFVAWGPELGFLYNDHYAEILGAKHPASLGARFHDIWAEIWPDIAPLIEAAIAGEASYREDLPLLMNRRGFDEQTWFTFSYSPVRNESGSVAGMFCAVQETTDRVLAHRALRELNETLEHRVAEALAEQRAAEEELRQLQKMEAIGQLTGGLAHDFINLLTGVLGNLELLETRLGADERGRKLVQAAARSAARGAQLTEQLLVFARKQHLDPKATDLNAVVCAVTDMLERTVGGGLVQVTTSLASNLWHALVDVTQIEVALLNLAINARDAMPLGGTIRIITHNIPAAADHPSDLVPGDYVSIELVDTGEGMSEEVLEKAFEPFFTTKELGKGTGLGLAQVYGIARQSGGTARITSKLGVGTSVELYLPRAAGAERDDNGKLPIFRQQQSRTVLVIDDQDDVREVVIGQLAALGHRAVPATDGCLGLELFATSAGSAGPIDLLLVDYAMPGKSGPEVAHAARRQH